MVFSTWEATLSNYRGYLSPQISSSLHSAEGLHTQIYMGKDLHFQFESCLSPALLRVL